MSSHLAIATAGYWCRAGGCIYRLSTAMEKSEILWVISSHKGQTLPSFARTVTPTCLMDSGELEFPTRKEWVLERGLRGSLPQEGRRGLTEPPSSGIDMPSASLHDETSTTYWVEPHNIPKMQEFPYSILVSCHWNRSDRNLDGVQQSTCFNLKSQGTRDLTYCQGWQQQGHVDIIPSPLPCKLCF